MRYSSSVPQTSVMYVFQLSRNAAVAEMLFIVDCSAFKGMAINLQHQCIAWLYTGKVLVS